MTIQELKKKILDAVDTYGIPRDAEIRIVTDKEGKVNIRAEYGCGFFLLAENVNKEN